MSGLKGHIENDIFLYPSDTNLLSKLDELDKSSGAQLRFQ